MVFHEPILGGATLSVLRLIPRLEGRGWRFSFWVPAGSALEEALRDRGFEVAGGDRTVSYSLRALRLPPGPHTIDFVFDPLSLRVGRAISYATLAFAATVLLAPLVWEALSRRSRTWKAVAPRPSLPVRGRGGDTGQ